MKQAIVILLKNDRKLAQIRKKYAPGYKLRSHITLVYPFEAKDRKKLFAHIREKIKNVHSFELSLRRLKKSAKEYYLYLLVDKGKDEIVKLSDKLNTGILKGLPRYIPHLTLGVFRTRREIDTVVKKLKDKNIVYKTKVSSVQLVTIGMNHSLKSIKNFKL